MRSRQGGEVPRLVLGQGLGQTGKTALRRSWSPPGTAGAEGAGGVGGCPTHRTHPPGAAPVCRFPLSSASDGSAAAGARAAPPGSQQC